MAITPEELAAEGAPDSVDFDRLTEEELAGHTTATGVSNEKLAMWAFLGSECLLFGALISTYFLYRGRSVVPPTPKQVYDIPFTSVSSFVLLMSSLTMVLALAAIQRGDHRRLRIWLTATALLGTVFIGGQVYEFTSFVHEGLSLRANLFGSSFFVLTGFHGVHVTVGIIMLLTLVMMSNRGKIPQAKAPVVEIAGLYWHFVDIVWIVIFTVVYLIPSPKPHVPAPPLQIR
jgi:cytochrome c oxidase subunit 3/cytochrome o ubiquinol oxidase subunit 3